jgi:putative peptide zinc metalloprotease protein
MSDTPSLQDLAGRLQSVEVGLRADLEVTRHLFRGQPWYIVRDPISFQTHRFSPHDYQILAALDSHVPLRDIFQRLVEQGTLAHGQEQDFYRFILSLHRLNYLALPLADGAALYRRFTQRQRAQRWQQAVNFLFLRIPLVNPDALLSRTVGYVRPLFTPAALLAWLVMMTVGGVILFQRWDSFQSPFHSLLANNTLLFLWAALVGLKVIHEFGHAYACKVFGGNVPEMGVFLVALTPCAYVDASTAWGFPQLRQRVAVSLAGMYFESIVAFLALVVWCWTDNALLSSWAHHVVVLSTILTLGFNINPLMRFDGYYVLSDLTGIPNLRQRSLEEVQALCKRYLLGIETATVDDTPGVRWFLRLYGVAAAGYKATLILAICTMIIMKFGMIGFALAAVVLVNVVVAGVRRLTEYLWRSEETRQVRLRAMTAAGALLVVPPVVLLAVPFPGTLVLPGVVETDDDRIVFAQAEGFLCRPERVTGDFVADQEPLCRVENVVTLTRLEQLRAEAALAWTEYGRHGAASPQNSRVAQLRWSHTQERLAHAQQEAGQLTVVAPVAGRVTQLVDDRDTGRFVRQGERVATVAAGGWIVRCLATAEQMARARPERGQGVRVRVVADGVREVAGTVQRVAIQGSTQVFASSLTQLGGGGIPVAPDSLEAGSALFEVWVGIDPSDALAWIHGSRAAVCFTTAPQTFGTRLADRGQRFWNRLRVR